MKNPLESINIHRADNVRGYIYLPEEVEGLEVSWESSAPDIVSAQWEGRIAPGVVRRPPHGEPAVDVVLKATATGADNQVFERSITVTVQPLPEPLAPFSAYAMVTFQNSDSEKIYGAVSRGNNALVWDEVAEGAPLFVSTYGSRGLRDPSVVRAPDGDRFFMVATDLHVKGPDFGGWGWAQTGGSRHIEVWESDDLVDWSPQRHVLVNTSPETGMTFAPEAIWDPTIGQYVVYWTSGIYPEGTYYTEDLNDPNRRETDEEWWGRNVTYYSLTRDFVHFSPSRVMSDRGHTWDSGYGNLDAMICFNPDDGYYYRCVQDRSDHRFDKLFPSDIQETTDLYLERSRTILAPASEWELIAGNLTINAVNGKGLGKAWYNEGPNLVKTNPGDENGQGFYLFADGGWEDNEGRPQPGLQPYFATDIASGDFTALPGKWFPPLLEGQDGPAAAHGNVFPVTAAEHAAFARATPATA